MLQSGHHCTGGVTYKSPFLQTQFAVHQSVVLVGYLFEIIDHIKINALRKKIFSDPFGNVRIDLILVENAGFFVLLEYRSITIDAPDPNFRVLFFQETADAANGASGPYSGNEMGNFAIGLDRKSTRLNSSH